MICWVHDAPILDTYDNYSTSIPRLSCCLWWKTLKGSQLVHYSQFLHDPADDPGDMLKRALEEDFLLVAQRYMLYFCILWRVLMESVTLVDHLLFLCWRHRKAFVIDLMSICMLYLVISTEPDPSATTRPFIRNVWTEPDFFPCLNSKKRCFILITVFANYR